MKKLKKIGFKLLMFLVMAGISSCGDNDMPSENENKEKNIYIAGYEDNPNGPRIAKLWINGSSTDLTDGSHDARAGGVFVYGNDVYVCGYERDDNNRLRAVVWKNGEKTVLDQNNYMSNAKSVFVSGNDVYVVGYILEERNTKYRATLWKNNSQIILSDNGDWSSYARSIYVNGNDVYVCGQHFNENTQEKVATLWKNGFKTYLDNSNNISSDASSIFIQNNDVYVVGRTGFTDVCIWKNNSKEFLQYENEYAGLKSVFVSDGNVYVAGFNKNNSGKHVATIWTNGTKSSISDGSFNSYLSDIKVDSNNIYAVGSENTIPTFWNNGVPTKLSSQEGYATSIFLK